MSEKLGDFVFFEKSEDKYCLDCVSWVGVCKKGVTGVIANSAACSDFGDRDFGSTEEWLVVIQAKHESKPQQKSFLSHGGLSVFSRPECNGCVFKGESYCWNQCYINVWKKKSDW